MNEVQFNNLMNDLAKQEIQERLGLSDFDCNTMVFENGMEYLNCYIESFGIQGATDKQLEASRQAWISEIAQTSIFWKWWTNQWKLRDRRFCQNSNSNRSIQPWSLAVYHMVHDPKVLAGQIYPNRVVMTETYEQMMSKLVAEKTK